MIKKKEEEGVAMERGGGAMIFYSFNYLRDN
jgi:hypothetical protein